MAGKIAHSQYLEPLQKRLRMKHLQDPLYQPASHCHGVERTRVGDLVHSFKGNVQSKISNISQVQWKALKVRHRTMADQSDAKKKWESDLKERWSRESKRCHWSPVLKGFLCRTRPYSFSDRWQDESNYANRYVKAWKAWQHWKGLTGGSDSFVHPGTSSVSLTSPVVLQSLYSSARQSVGLRK